MSNERPWGRHLLVLGLVSLMGASLPQRADALGSNCLAEARRLTYRQEFVAGAQMAAECWESEGALEALWHSAKSWQFAGFYAHADAQLMLYRARKQLTSGEASDARDLEREIRKHAIKLKLRLEARHDRALEGEITAEYLAEPTRPLLRFPIRVPPGDQILLTRYFDPGTWKVTVSLDGYLPYFHVYELDLQHVNAPVALVPAQTIRAPEVPEEVQPPEEVSPPAPVPVSAPLPPPPPLTLPVEFSLLPERAVHRGVRVRLSVPSENGVREHYLSQAHLRLNLPEGNWSAEVTSRGFEPRVVGFLLSKESRPVGPVELKLRYNTEVRVRIGLAIAHASLAVPALAAGTTLALSIGDLKRNCTGMNVVSPCTNSVTSSLLGASFLGIGTSSAILAAINGAERPRGWWWAAFGSGVAAAIVGVPLSEASRKEVERLPKEMDRLPDVPTYLKLTHSRIAGIGLASAGLTLVTGAAISLLVDYLVRRSNPTVRSARRLSPGPT